VTGFTIVLRRFVRQAMLYFSDAAYPPFIGSPTGIG
jgi:hypothetical protein